MTPYERFTQSLARARARVSARMPHRPTVPAWTLYALGIAVLITLMALMKTEHVMVVVAVILSVYLFYLIMRKPAGALAKAGGALALGISLLFILELIKNNREQVTEGTAKAAPISVPPPQVIVPTLPPQPPEKIIVEIRGCGSCLKPPLTYDERVSRLRKAVIKQARSEEAK